MAKSGFSGILMLQPNHRDPVEVEVVEVKHQFQLMQTGTLSVSRRSPRPNVDVHGCAVTIALHIRGTNVPRWTLLMKGLQSESLLALQ